MRKILIPTIVVLIFASCGTTKYVPVETVKVQYRDKLIQDSVVRYDSVFVKQKADTVFFERYKYLYKNKIIRDSIFIQDTIRVPYLVEVTKQVKAPLSGWQNFQLWCSRALLALALLAGLYLVLRLKKKLQ